MEVQASCPEGPHQVSCRPHENWLRDSTLKFSAEIRKKSEKNSKSKKKIFFSFLAILDHSKHFGKKICFCEIWLFPTLDCWPVDSSFLAVYQSSSSLPTWTAGPWTTCRRTPVGESLRCIPIGRGGATWGPEGPEVGLKSENEVRRMKSEDTT